MHVCAPLLTGIQYQSRKARTDLPYQTASSRAIFTIRLSPHTDDQLPIFTPYTGSPLSAICTPSPPAPATSSAPPDRATLTASSATAAVPRASFGAGGRRRGRQCMRACIATSSARVCDGQSLAWRGVMTSLGEVQPARWGKCETHAALMHNHAMRTGGGEVLQPRLTGLVVRLHVVETGRVGGRYPENSPSCLSIAHATFIRQDVFARALATLHQHAGELDYLVQCSCDDRSDVSIRVPRPWLSPSGFGSRTELI